MLITPIGNRCLDSAEKHLFLLGAYHLFKKMEANSDWADDDYRFTYLFPHLVKLTPSQRIHALALLLTYAINQSNGSLRLAAWNESLISVIFTTLLNLLQAELLADNSYQVRDAVFIATTNNLFSQKIDTSKLASSQIGSLSIRENYLDKSLSWWSKTIVSLHAKVGRFTLYEIVDISQINEEHRCAFIQAYGVSDIYYNSIVDEPSESELKSDINLLNSLFSRFNENSPV